MNLIPSYNAIVSLGGRVTNGSPARSAHIATVDTRLTWLGFIAHPMTPHILRGSAETSNTSGGAIPGIETGSDHGVDVLIPPGVGWLQWGVIALGKGPISATALGRDYELEVAAAGSTDIGTAQTVWATKTLPTYAADQPAAIDCTTAVTTGSRRPRLITIEFNRPSGSAKVIAVLFRYLPNAPGTDLSGFAASSAGGTDL